MSVGTNIKNRRIELRMSQQELANAMGYKTRSTIAKIESGENDVSQRKIQRFADILNTTVEALISVAPVAQESVVPAKESIAPGRNKNVAIILAGGNSDKNNQSIPIQFVTVQGKPIIVYSMDAYQAHPSIDDIYIVCVKGWENIVEAYANQHGITKLKGLIPAGKNGITSLKKALDHIQDLYMPNDLIFIQEATRPLVSVETISNLLQACSEKDSATICYSMRDYVQFNISGKKTEYVNRNTMFALQSPEAHRLSLLNKVFQKANKLNYPLTESCFTMLLYSLGFNINFIESKINNIKISEEKDLTNFYSMIKA